MVFLSRPCGITGPGCPGCGLACRLQHCFWSAASSCCRLYFSLLHSETFSTAASLNSDLMPSCGLDSSSLDDKWTNLICLNYCLKRFVHKFNRPRASQQMQRQWQQSLTLHCNEVHQLIIWNNILYSLCMDCWRTEICNSVESTMWIAHVFVIQ